MTRGAAEIGRGLAPSRAAHPIGAGERIHVVGAAGAGASAAALLAHHAGGLVTGCDPGSPSPYTAALAEAGITVATEHSAAHIAAERPQRLAVTKALTAVDPDHPELVAARSAGVPLEAWQQVVADAAATSGQRLVAVAGTHGKSTTTGWLVDLLVRAGRDPSAFVGALLEPRLSGGPAGTARWGRGDLFVVEADEYAGNFDAYQPSVAVLLNAEWDHPDVFADETAVLDAFVTWLRRAAAAGDVTLVANAGDSGVARVIERLAGWSGRIVTFSLDGAADIAATLEIVDGRSRLTGVSVGGSETSYEVGLPGSANAANALAVVAAAQVLGVPQTRLRQSLASYAGVRRRMELKGEVGGVVVIDDYGHHPTAIARTLEAVRLRYPGRRVWAVYEPLTYHRTATMLTQFARVLATADEVAIADIWAGRDPDTTLTSAAELAKAVTAAGGPKAAAPGSVELTADYLAERVKPGDVVLVMGGGRSYVIAARLVDLLRARA